MRKIQRPKTIFIVDDDIDDQELFMEALSEVDVSIHCYTAINGEEALDTLQQQYENLPDYIFLDLNLPRLNGKQCLTEIKKDPMLKNIPVIIYSTSSQQKDMEESLELGASRFLTKPCNFKELCEKLAEIMNLEIPSGIKLA